jgi:hypothetical protein
MQMASLILKGNLSGSVESLRRDTRMIIMLATLTSIPRLEPHTR